MRHISSRLLSAVRLFGVIAFSMCFHARSFAQPDRIAAPIDDGRRYTIRGSVHRLAQSLYDRGRAEKYWTIERLTLVLKPSETQDADLDRLLGQLHDPNSPNYLKWLTSESYADRFGLSQDDIAKIADWLTAEGFTVTDVSRARNAIMARGSIESVERAFQTEIHIYEAAGEMHYGNATNPSLPGELEGIVVAIHGLHDFHLRPTSPMLRILLATQGEDTPNFISNSGGKHDLEPGDFASMFEAIKPQSDPNRSPQSIAVVGQSQIDPSHLSTFRSRFGLGDAELTTTVVPNTQDPGTRRNDARQSELDLEWASAVARDATLHFVYSNDVIDAVQYAIDQNLAPVLAMSYGECATSCPSDEQTMRVWTKQANALGITWVAASGDSGAAGCYHSQ